MPGEEPRREALKVLYIIQSSPEPSGRAVIKRRLSEFLPYLVSSETEISLVTLIGEGDVHLHLAYLPIETGTLGANLRVGLPLAVLRLRRLLRRQDYDVIHASESLPALVAGFARRGSSARPALAFFRYHEYGSWRLQVVSRKAARLSDVTLVQSEAVARRAIELDRTPRSRIRVVRPGTADLRGVEPYEVADLKRKLRIPAAASVIGGVSRIRPEKGFDVLVRAMDLLQERDVPAHLVIAGDGSALPELREQAEKILGNRAHLVGHQDDVGPWYALLDLVVMPSRREAFGFSSVESMAAGRPLVASSVGGLREAIVDGTTGTFVPPDDPARLAAAIDDLLDDPSRRLHMGKQARKRYEDNFTLHHQADDFRDAWVWTLATVAER